MSAAAPSRLEQLAATDATLAPLARLQAIALAARDDQRWRPAAVRLRDAAADAPMLDGADVGVDADAVRGLLERLAAAAGRDVAGVDALALLRASIAQREDDVRAIAADEARAGELMTLGQLLAWPLLLALREGLPERTAAWDRGYCPVCGAWPLLSELRGVDRERIARCGRCAAGWKIRHSFCVFCGNDDHRALRSLSLGEDVRESRFAVACDRCHGALKSVATLLPLDAEGLAASDLSSIEVDLAAMVRGYGRPAAPAVAFHVEVHAV